MAVNQQKSVLYDGVVMVVVGEEHNGDVDAWKLSIHKINFKQKVRT